MRKRKPKPKHKHKQLMLSENERRHKHQNQPRHPPFCSNAQTRGIWNECFNWPDAANFLLLIDPLHKWRPNIWITILDTSLASCLCLKTKDFSHECVAKDVSSVVIQIWVYTAFRFHLQVIWWRNSEDWGEKLWRRIPQPRAALGVVSKLPAVLPSPKLNRSLRVYHISCYWMNVQVEPTRSNLASAMLNSKIRPRAVVGYGVNIFLPSPPNYVTRSPG